MIKRIFAPGTYITYPHSNSFADAGHSLVLGQKDEKTFSLWKIGLPSGERQPLASFPLHFAHDGIAVWFDISQNNVLAVFTTRFLLMLDLKEGGGPVPIYEAPEGTRILDTGSIRSDGKKVLLGLQEETQFSVQEVDVASGESVQLFSKPWHVNHLHYCPHDESWIGFCHEDGSEVLDRVWVWHPQHAPEGRCIFDQKSSGRNEQLFVGHERWSFHQTSAYVVAYAISPGGPKGLYEVFPDAPPRLVSEGNHDWHCNISADGRWAVVDTNEPDNCEIVLIDTQTGARRLVARVNNPFWTHPFHPHPAFSPDGKWLAFNDATAGVQLIELDNL